MKQHHQYFVWNIKDHAGGFKMKKSTKLPKQNIYVALVVAFFFLPLGPILFSSNGSAGTEDAAAAWHFDAGTGQKALDSSGNSNHGKIVGASWTEGVRGYALEFDGKNDYVLVLDSDSLDISEEITIASWIKVDSAKKRPVVVSKAKAFCIRVIPFKKDGFRIKGTLWLDGKPRSVKMNLKNESMETDQWYHIALTYDGKTMRLYLNGELQASSKKKGEINTNSKDLFIGKSWKKRKHRKSHLDGCLDDLLIFGHALSKTEVAKLATIATTAPNVINVDLGVIGTSYTEVANDSSSDYDTDDELDINKLELKVDDFLYVKSTYDANVDFNNDQDYAVLIDLDKDGTFDVGYGTYFSDPPGPPPASEKIYLYSWSGSDWTYITSWSTRHTISTTTLEVKIDLTEADELNSDTDFDLIIVTYDGEDTTMYDGGDMHEVNGPSTWSDYLG